MPTGDEAQTLFLKDEENVGKGGISLHLDKVFPEGAFKTSWLSGDTSTKRPRFDFIEGKMLWAEEYSFGSVRLCRKGPLPKASERKRSRR